METFTVQAIYKKGVLRPKTRLNLPEDSVVEVQVKMDKTRAGFGSLLGIWSHLSDAEVEDLEKHLAQIRRKSGLKVKTITKRKPASR